jgi:alkanesulfonate monooxygenase SsuD/methylene tetrahydromethanopterin reductase-like flavin-dependent oxidoreductase (luciferase family)
VTHVEFGAHLPLMDFGDNEYDGSQFRSYAQRAAALGFTTLAANDHLIFAVPWLDGPTALASVIGSSGSMTLATTVSLPVVRGPVALAKSLAAIDRLSGGRLVVAVGSGSSARDYELVGLDFEERWARLDEAICALRCLWHAEREPFVGKFYSTQGVELTPAPAQQGGPPIWVASWGSDAGMRRVARLGDGWLASAYNTTPAMFAAGWSMLRELLEARGRDAAEFRNALGTMWFHITDDSSEADAIVRERMGPAIHRPVDQLRARLPVGSAEACAELLADFREAGVQQVFAWPVVDEIRQLERFRDEVWPLVTGAP